MKVTIEGTLENVVEHLGWPLTLTRSERCFVIMRRLNLTNSDIAARVNVPGVVMSHRRVSDVLRPNQPMDSMGRSMSGRTREVILEAIEAVLTEEGE
ncbi:MAG: hypothetical protein KOO60_10800 [Gemmatimonadales bacterium]|nr:hypothetical protein [Gemmatimonadales bacterium]